MHWNWNWLSTPGNSAVVLPLLLFALVLLASQRREHARVAQRWLVAAIAASALVTASKIAFYGWGTGIRAWNLTSPSGHTVLALVFWPMFLTLLLPAQRPRWRHAATVVGIVLALACGASRLMTRAHPMSEVLAGVLLGGAAVAFVLHALRGTAVQLPRTTTAAALLAAVGLGMALKPMELPTERWFARAGAYFADRETPVQRKAWLRQDPAAAATPGRP